MEEPCVPIAREDSLILSKQELSSSFCLSAQPWEKEFLGGPDTSQILKHISFLSNIVKTCVLDKEFKYFYGLPAPPTL